VVVAERQQILTYWKDTKKRESKESQKFQRAYIPIRNVSVLV
jgi:hypothetical protein